MNKYSRLLGTVGAAALAALAANPALADTTDAGVTITNTVTVNYQVGTVSQTATGASNSFKVDRKVTFVVAEVGGTATQVSPGATEQVTTFTVTNNSNATLDFALTTGQLNGGAGAHGGTDSFDVTTVKIYLDDGDNSFDSGDTEVTYLEEMTEGETRKVYVVANVPLSLTTGSVATVSLTATAREGSTPSALGAALSETNTGTANEVDPMFVDTVFADAAGSDDAQYDGAHSARDDYSVLAAALTVVKRSKVISDPVNGTTNPKAIPGATIEYCISVANASGSATASSVAISDPLPATVTYDSGYGIFVDGSVTGGECDANGTSGGSYDAGTTTVTGTLSSIAATETKTLRFRATID